MNPINETTTTLPLHVTFAPTSIMKFQLLQTLAGAFEAQAATTSGGGGELDAIKRVLIDGNPWLLLSTVVVGILHMLTSTLAFASDISHTRKRKDLVGVSVRTILSNVFVELVVLLYLWDESEQTSSMILLTQGMGLAVEAWKITKAVDIKVGPSAPGSLLPYKVEFKDKHVLTEDEIKSREYDRQAFKIVGWAAAPCLAAYSVYSFLYNEHRGYYSFILKTIVSFVHLGGFALLIPQVSSARHLRRFRPATNTLPRAIAADHQLPTQVDGSPPQEDDDLQVPRHDHRRPRLVRDQAAAPASDRLLPR